MSSLSNLLEYINIDIHDHICDFLVSGLSFVSLVNLVLVNVKPRAVQCMRVDFCVCILLT